MSLITSRMAKILMDSVQRLKKSSTGVRGKSRIFGISHPGLTSGILISKNPEYELDHIKDGKDIDGFW